jgi:hypothetical protein
METFDSVLLFIGGIIGIAWFVFAYGSLAKATYDDAKEGQVHPAAIAFWVFVGTCVLIGILRCSS